MDVVVELMHIECDSSPREIERIKCAARDEILRLRSENAVIRHRLEEDLTRLRTERDSALERAALRIEGASVAVNSKHLTGWGSATLTEKVVEMLTERDKELASSIRALKGE